MSTYGIDLGTSNSLIGLHSEGFLSELVPSCVNMETGECGVSMYDDMRAKRSYKVDISMGAEGIPSVVASSHVLKKLVEVAGGNVKDVVITVPAYFSDSQRNATIEAASRIGLNVLSIINEPTAAAIYISQQKKGLYVVFDLGGGTFDVSIIDSRFGAFDVQATGGLKVGGDNFDKNLMRYVLKESGIKMFRLEDADLLEIQHACTKHKVRMQKERSQFEVDMSRWGGTSVTLTPEIYKEIMYATFSSAMKCMQRIVSGYMQEGDEYEILPVGGSTRCPYLREWILETMGVRIADLDYDPDKVVALGAALYADLIDKGEASTSVSDVTRQLSIGLHDGTCKVLVPNNSKIPLSVDHMFVNPKDMDTMEIELYQGENTFYKDNELIGSIVWDYGCVKEAWTGQVQVKIDIDARGIVTLTASELMKPPKVLVLDRRQC